MVVFIDRFRLYPAFRELGEIDVTGTPAGKAYRCYLELELRFFPIVPERLRQDVPKPANPGEGAF